MRTFFCDTLYNSWNTALFFIKQLLLCKLSDGTGYIYKRRVEFSPGTENSTSRHRDRERAAHDMGVLTYSHLTVIHPRKDKGNPENLGNTTSSHNDPETPGASTRNRKWRQLPPHSPHTPRRTRHCACALGEALSPFLRRLHRRVETGGRADAGLNPGGFPGRSCTLSAPVARMGMA